MTLEVKSPGMYRGFHARKHTLAARYPKDPEGELMKGMQQRLWDMVKIPFRGFTADGTVEPGLFALEETGVSTRPIMEAANAFIATVSEEQMAMAFHDVDSDYWRMWHNPEMFIVRHGIMLESMPPAQLEACLNLMKASLSIHGYNLTRDTMRLNESLREITHDDDNLGEWLYFFCIFGTPSMDRPWGWQLDGHHLNLNCFVLGDQMVVTPSFYGAEPCMADDGKYAGLRIFEEEERNGLDLIRSLSPVLREKAIIFSSTKWEDIPLERNMAQDGRMWSGAFKDNAILPYEGARGDEMTKGQRAVMLDLIQTYTGRLRAGHAEVKLEEIKHHLDNTYFAWMGKFGDNDPFYYKIHSPVVLIEFDHHHGVYLDNYNPEKFHAHTIVRTPNGNDYGKDLLRQHYERYPH